LSATWKWSAKFRLCPPRKIYADTHACQDCCWYCDAQSQLHNKLLLEFFTHMFVNVIQVCKPNCAAWTSRCCFERSGVVQAAAKTLWREILRLTNDLWRKTFLRTRVRRRFAEPGKHLLISIEFCSRMLTYTWNSESLQMVCFQITVPFILASIWLLTMKWSKQKVLTGGNISRRHLALRCLSCEVHWLICCSKTALWPMNKNNEEQHKKSIHTFLAGKLEMSVYQNSSEWSRG